MAFDIDGAKKAGYSDTEIADYLGKQQRFDTGAARKAGYSDAELISHLAQPAKQTATTVGTQGGAVADGASGSPRGQKTPGNIDLTKRKVLNNPDGSFSTESSFSIGTDDGEVLLPSVIDGNRVSNREAIDHYRQTGEHLGIFDTPDNADAYAESLHNQQGQRYGDQAKQRKRTAYVPGMSADEVAQTEQEMNQPPPAPVTAPPAAFEQWKQSFKQTMSDVGTQVMDAVNLSHKPSVADLAEQMSNDPARQQENPAAVKLPINPQYREQFNDAWDSMTDGQRARMAQQPGVVGQLAAERAGMFDQQDKTAVSAADSFDTRVEKRAARLVEHGIDPEMANLAARYGASVGVSPGGENEMDAYFGGRYGHATPLPFDADADETFRDKSVVTRGAAKGALALGQGVVGTLKFIADAAGTKHVAASLGSARDKMSGIEAGIGDHKANASYADRQLESTVASIGQQLPFMIAGAASGGSSIPLTAIFVTSFGQEYSNGETAKLNFADRTTRAATFGTLEVLGEALGLGPEMKALRGIAKGLPTEKILHLFAEAAVKEAPGELFTSTGEFAFDKFAPGMGLTPDATFEDYLEVVRDTLAQTMMQSAIVGGGGTAVGATVHAARGGIANHNARTAEINADAAQRSAIDKWQNNGLVRQPSAPKSGSPNSAPSAAAPPEISTDQQVAVGTGVPENQPIQPEVNNAEPSPAPAAAAPQETAPAVAREVAQPAANSAGGGQQTSTIDRRSLADAFTIDDQGTIDAAQAERAVRAQVAAALEAGNSVTQGGGRNMRPVARAEDIDVAKVLSGLARIKIGPPEPASAAQPEEPTLAEKAREAAKDPVRIEPDDEGFTLVINGVRGATYPTIEIAKEEKQHALDTLQQHADKIVDAHAIDTAAHAAATSPQNELPEPTPAQVEAGNYQKGHIKLHGLDISIENPKGSIRRSKPGALKTWERKMTAHYGYVRGSEGADGDHVDVFVGDNHDSDKVYVIDQVINGKFDEHKVIAGVDSEDAARKLYADNYQKGWKGLGAITEMDVDTFKDWVKTPAAKKPLAWKPDKPTYADQEAAERVGEPIVETLPMLKASKTYQGIPSARLTLQQYKNGKWDFGLDLATNNTGLASAPRASNARFDTKDEARAAAVERGLRFSQTGPESEREHRDWIGAWLKGEKPKKSILKAESKPVVVEDADELRSRGEEITSSMDAERRFSDGEQIYGFHEMDESKPTLITSLEMLSSYQPDQLVALPALKDVTPVKTPVLTVEKPAESESTSGTKLSESDNSDGIAIDRAKGKTPEAFANWVKGRYGKEEAARLTADGQVAKWYDAANPKFEAAPTDSTPIAVSKNTIFTEDAAAKARALLKSKLGNANTGLDPEVIQAGITLAGYHIEKGSRTFAAYSRAMIADLGEVVRPYLRGWYEAIRYHPGAVDMAAEMDSAADIDKPPTKVDERVPSTNTDLERDSGNATAQDATVAEPVQVDRPAEGSETSGGQVDSARRGHPDDQGFPDGSTALPGKLSDQSLHPGVEQDGPTELPARSGDGERSDDPGIEGVPPESITTDQVDAFAVDLHEDARKRAEQRKADSVAINGSLENVRATLPYLQSGQQEDVHKAETRYGKSDGYGYLLTNGTGTGKTFSGLGVVKRYARRGKKNILIVVPDAKISSDWVTSAKALGLNVTPLADTKDRGSGITITSYANLGQNDELAKRNWDFVVADEAHQLMQSANGDQTLGLNALRAITMHPRGVHTRYEMLYREDVDRMKANAEKFNANVLAMKNGSAEQLAKLQAENTVIQKEQDVLREKSKADLEKVREEVEAAQGAGRTRMLALSATPFAYEKTIDWADGYLFDYGKASEEGRSYSRGDAREQFFMQHFGYRMRYGKLTEPDSNVDRGLMQRQFNGWLKKNGALSSRMLDVPYDYDRRFVLVDSAIGNQIDRAMEYIDDQRKAFGEDKANKMQENGWALLDEVLQNDLYGKLGHLTRRYLLEAIKAKEVIPVLRQHLALSRKIVVFHDFKKGGSHNPFAFPEVALPSDPKEAAKVKAFNAAAAVFRDKFPDLSGDLLSELISPIDRFKKEFPDVLLINGDEKKADLLKRYKMLQDDSVGPIIALVQSDKNKGWSGHDTTGKYQRVLFNLGLPTQPTKSIQQEGRIYRIGQVSNAIFRYMNTGTNWERWAFAQTIAERASAAENLGMGEQARALKDAYIAGFEESGHYPAGHEGEGTGGKERDQAANNALSEYDRARAFYFGTQKKDSRTKAQEGTDYFATPEPLGLKMVQWADPRGGEDFLEPSAGHGAIARWAGEKLTRTAIEPSNALGSRLAMVFDGKIIRGDFESHNVINKYDTIVMNPPFGSGGRTAIDHLEKAAKHLREGGRIVAVIPTGPSADAKFDKWFYGEEREKNSAKGLHLVAEIILPAVAFDRAGTKAMTKVLVLEKPQKGATPPNPFTRDLSNATDIKELFDRLENMDVKPRAKPVAEEQKDRFITHVEAVQRREAEKQAAAQAGAQVAADTGQKIIEHVTGSGKTLRGVVRKDMTLAQAKEIDPYTFKKNGGFYIRERHLAELEQKFPSQQPLMDLAEDKQEATANAVRRALAQMAGYEVDPIERKSALIEIGRLRKRLESGKISSAEFAFDIEALHAKMLEATAAKRLARLGVERVRGPDFIRQRLIEAKRNGYIDAETSDFAEWFILKNPALVDELGISIKEASAEEKGAAGRYMPTTKIMRLMKGRARLGTAVHEILHHMERLMPPEMQAAIRKEYWKQLEAERVKAVKAGNEKLVKYLDDAAKVSIARDSEAEKSMKDAMLSHVVPGEHYQFFNPSEFWAVNMTELLSARYQTRNSIWKRIKQWMKEALQHARKVLRLPSDSPMIKVLDELIEGSDGQSTAKFMLHESALYENGMYRDLKKFLPKGAVGAVNVHNKIRNEYGNFDNTGEVYLTKDGLLMIDGTAVAPGDVLYASSHKKDWRLVKSLPESDFEDFKRSWRPYLDNLIKYSSLINRSVAKSSPNKKEKLTADDYFVQLGIHKEGDVVDVRTDDWEKHRYPWTRNESDRKDARFVDSVSDLHDPEAIERAAYQRSLDRERKFEVGGILHVYEKNLSPEFNNALLSYQSRGGRLGKSALDALGESGGDYLDITDTPFSAPTPGKEVGAGKFKTDADTFLYNWQDKHIDTKRVTQAIEKLKGELPDETNPYQAEELYHQRAAYRTERFLTDELKPLLEAAKKLKVEVSDLEHYLWARHAEERNQTIAERNVGNEEMQDGGSGMLTADAKAYMAELTPERREALEALAERVDKMTDATRQTLVGYGLESQATMDMRKSVWPNYVPLHRADYENEASYGVGQGFSVKGSDSKAALGSKRKVVNVLAEIAKQREQAIVRGEKNRVAAALFGLAKDNPNDAWWSTTNMPRIRYMDKDGQAASMVDPKWKSRENVVVVRFPNKTGRIVERGVIFNERNPRAMRMAQSLKNLDTPEMEGVIGAMAKVSRYIAAVNTQYNPVFGLRNLQRDIQEGMLNATNTAIKGKAAKIAKYSTMAIRGIYQDARAKRHGKHPNSEWATWFEEMEREGGTTGYRQLFETSADRAKAILNEFKQLDESYIGKKSLRAIGNWLSDYNLTCESAVRVAAYRTARESGLSKAKSASIAKNLTINFNRKGRNSQQANALYAFFNAKAQGQARFLQTLTGPSGKAIIAGGLLIGVMQAVALSAMGFDDNDPPEFVKQQNLIIPYGDGKYFIWNMPQSMQLLVSLGRIPTEAAIRQGKSGYDAMMSMFSTVVDSFNPMGASTPLQTILPTAVDPIGALAENENWNGQPIYQEKFDHNDPAPGFTRGKDTSSAIGKVVSRGLNLLSGGSDYVAGHLSPTPDQIDYLLDQVTGGPGREVSKAQQAITSLATGEDIPDYKIPLWGHYFGNANSKSSERSRFFSLAQKGHEYKAELEGRAGEAAVDSIAAKQRFQEYLGEHPDAQVAIQAVDAANQVSKIRKAKRQAAANGQPQSALNKYDDQVAAVISQTLAREKAFRQEARQ